MERSTEENSESSTPRKNKNGFWFTLVAIALIFVLTWAISTLFGLAFTKALALAILLLFALLFVVVIAVFLVGIG